MSSIAFFKAPFDPITKSEVDFAKRLLHEGYGHVVFVVDGEGVLDEKTRRLLVQRALAPYRKLSLGECDEACIHYKQGILDEASVRGGQFYRAAHGIHRVLIEQGYYLESVVDTLCNPKRAAHSRSVAKVARDIAVANGADGEVAYRLGLLHDITKKQDDAWHERLLRIYAPDKLELSPKVWHSFTAPLVMKHDLGIYDRTMLRAVWCHTMGDGTGIYDKILFAADKIEPTRQYDSTKEIACCMNDINAGFALVKEEELAYLRKEGVHV